ncbi:MAG: hypothetical protein IT384_25160 [Deltaproteobacteria bacterium]|nr:hypothetical protein [Deltaproteobacteria bacterium]
MLESAPKLALRSPPSSRPSTALSLALMITGACGGAAESPAQESFERFATGADAAKGADVERLKPDTGPLPMRDAGAFALDASADADPDAEADADADADADAESATEGGVPASLPDAQALPSGDAGAAPSPDGGASTAWCQGISAPCDLQSSFHACQATPGCLWAPEECYGAAYDCAGFYDPGWCLDQGGCDWDPVLGECYGFAYPCASLDLIDCGYQAGCGVLLAECLGQAVNLCENASQSVCQSTAGCRWR